MGQLSNRNRAFFASHPCIDKYQSANSRMLICVPIAQVSDTTGDAICGRAGNQNLLPTICSERHAWKAFPVSKIRDRVIIGITHCHRLLHFIARKPHFVVHDFALA